MHYSTFLSMGVAVLHFSSTALSLSIPKEHSLQTRADESVVPFPFDEADFSELEATFNLIEKIPDSALAEGQAAVSDWLTSQLGSSTVAVRDTSAALESRQSALQIANCAGSILKAIIEFALPISKLSKVRKLIKALGGARKVAKMLLKAKSWKQIYQIGGAKLEELAKILLGADEIIQNCFMFL